MTIITITTIVTTFFKLFGFFGFFSLLIQIPLKASFAQNGISACNNHTNRNYPDCFQQEKICNNIFHVSAPAFMKTYYPALHN